MNKIIFKLLIISFIFNSCTNNPNYVTVDDVKNNIKLDKIPKLKLGKFSDIYESVNLVKLETNENSLIGRIDKMLVSHDRIFILDQVQSKSVFEFDLTGKFIRKYGNVGKGPGEFDEPNDFDIDYNNKELYIWNNSLRKILVFDLNGKFVKEVRTSFYSKNITSMGNGLFALYQDASYSSNPNNVKSNLIIINDKGRMHKTALPIEKQNSVNKGGFGTFYKYGNKTFITPNYSNEIYELFPDSIVKRSIIDFGQHNIPLKMIESSKKDLDNKISNSDYAFLNQFFDNEQYLIFEFVCYGQVFTGIYSKKTNELKYGNVYFNDLNGILAGINATLYKNQLFSYYDPSRIDDFKKQIKFPVNVTKLKEAITRSFPENDFKEVNDFITPLDFNYSKAEIEFLNTIKSTDNPIVIIQKLKSY